MRCIPYSYSTSYSRNVIEVSYVHLIDACIFSSCSDIGASSLLVFLLNCLLSLYTSPYSLFLHMYKSGVDNNALNLVPKH